MNKTHDTADWKAMYMTLFHGITDALERLPATPENVPAADRLSKALQDAEERYISQNLRLSRRHE